MFVEVTGNTSEELKEEGRGVTREVTGVNKNV